MNQKQIFLKASRIVRTRGLKKGDYGTVDGPVCMYGALNEVETGYPGEPTRDTPFPVLEALEYDTGVLGCDWSDKPSTTADEVADVLWLLGQVAE